MTSSASLVTLSPQHYDAVLFDGVLTETASVHAWVLARSDRPRAMSYFAEALQSNVSDRTTRPPRRPRSFKQHII
jgi:hypothetical protein